MKNEKVNNINNNLSSAPTSLTDSARLSRIMELKQLESEIRAERQALENEIASEYGSGTHHTDDGFCITVRPSVKYSLAPDSTPPSDIQLYKTVLDETVLKRYADEEWVSTKVNKPTVTVVKEK